MQIKTQWYYHIFFWFAENVDSSLISHCPNIMHWWMDKLCYFLTVELSSVQLFSRVQLFVTPWTAACQASMSIINSQSLLKLMSIKSVMTSNHLMLCCSLLLLPSIFPSIRGFSNKSVLRIRWPKYWSLVSSISCQWCSTGNKMVLTF